MKKQLAFITSLLLFFHFLAAQKSAKELLLESFWLIQQDKLVSAQKLLAQIDIVAADSLYIEVAKSIANSSSGDYSDNPFWLKIDEHIFLMAGEASQNGKYDWANQLLLFLKNEVPDSLKSGFYAPPYNWVTLVIARNLSKGKQTQNAKSLFLQLTADTLKNEEGFFNSPYWPSVHLSNIYLDEAKYDSAFIYQQIAERYFWTGCSWDNSRFWNQSVIRKARIYAGLGQKGRAFRMLLPFAFSPDEMMDEGFIFEEEFPLSSLNQLLISCLADSVGSDSLKLWVKTKNYHLLAKDSLEKVFRDAPFEEHCSQCSLSLGNFSISLWDKKYYVDLRNKSVDFHLLYSQAHCEEAVFQSVFWQELLKWVENK